MKEVYFFCYKRIADPLKLRIADKYPSTVLRIIKIEDVPERDGMVKITVEYSSPEVLIWLGEDKMFVNLTIVYNE